MRPHRTHSEVCWAVASATGDVVWVTNFADGTVSSYAVAVDGSLRVLEAEAGTTVRGAKGVRDAARSGDGRYLYAIDADAQRLIAWATGPDGALETIGETDGLPITVAALAAV